MSRPFPDVPLFRAFECLTFDSVAQEDLFPVPAHVHYFSEVILVRSGICRVVRGTRAVALQPGELIYISPLVSHSVDSADGKPVVFDVVKFSATRLREIPSYLSDLHSFSQDAAHAHLPVRITAEEAKALHLDSVVRECVVQYTRQDFAWDLEVRALIYLLITGLARFWLAKRDLIMDPTSATPDPILEIPAYIESHISESLRVEDLAARCSLSYPWFAKRFHELYGLSCKQFIRHMRTEAVEQYLIHSDMDLAEISSRTGYTDSSHMVKDFRQMVGLTPGQFRSTMRAQGRSPFSRVSASSDPNHAPKG